MADCEFINIEIVNSDWMFQIHHQVNPERAISAMTEKQVDVQFRGWDDGQGRTWEAESQVRGEDIQAGDQGLREVIK